VSGIFLTAEWRYVSMLNFEVDPVVLTPLLPKGTELDDDGGRHFVSLIGFLFLDTHVLGVPAFFHRDFEEVNLRFYVRRDVGTEKRHGVVFIRELVPLPLVAGAARLTYNEPYRTIPIRHTLVATEGELQSIEFCFGGPHEEFLSHRLWGYTRQRDGGTVEYRVDHLRWNVWSPVVFELDGPLAEFYDEPFASILREAPVSAFIADGSAVAVHLPERIA
jgi:uncharacterized protein YqjF (DUF2071 family)